jgi:hypothetical protein|nr:MAG TPA: hypothetical protein [Caudoviricetes sp.]
MTKKTKKRVTLSKQQIEAKKENREDLYLYGLLFIAHLLKTIFAEDRVEDYKSAIKKGDVSYEDAERFSDLLKSIDTFKDVTPEAFLLSTDDKLDMLKDEMDERDECYDMFEEIFNVKEKDVKGLIKMWKKENKEFTLLTLLQISSTATLFNFIYYVRGMVKKKDFEKALGDFKQFSLVPKNVFALTRRLVFKTARTISNYFTIKIKNVEFDITNKQHAEWLNIVAKVMELATTHSERKEIERRSLIEEKQ